MPFTTTFTTITTAQTAADAPLDTTLMESIRQDAHFLYDWIGGGYTPNTSTVSTVSPAHNHDGVNSAPVGGTQSTGVYILCKSTNEETTISTAYSNTAISILKRLKIGPQGGNFGLRYTLRRSSAVNDTAFAQVFVNDTTYNPEVSTTSISGLIVTITLSSLSAGDIVEIRGRIITSDAFVNNAYLIGSNLVSPAFDYVYDI